MIGALLAIAALVLMIIFASLYASAWHIVSFSLFGASMILLYTASALYHFYCKTHHKKALLQKWDRAMIYVLIAGSYTPITLIALHGAWGWSIFGIIWAFALLGIFLEFFLKERKNGLSLLLYLVMGWCVVIAIDPLLQNISLAAFLWLLLGGISYTLGACFFLLDKYISGKRWLSFHDIFHLLVIAGSFSHFWFMLHYLLYIPV